MKRLNHFETPCAKKCKPNVRVIDINDVDILDSSTVPDPEIDNATTSKSYVDMAYHIIGSNDHIVSYIKGLQTQSCKSQCRDPWFETRNQTSEGDRVY